MISIRRSKIVTILCLAFLGFASIWLGFGGRWKEHSQPWFLSHGDSSVNGANDASAAPWEPGILSFWDKTAKTLLDAKPQASLPDEHVEALINNYGAAGKFLNYRQDLIRLSDEDVDELRQKHEQFVDKIPQLAQELPYEPGTQGIVTTAAGEFVPILVVSLRMLRRTGSKIPVHVFMESRDVYEKDVCERILPSLNATCFVMSDVLDEVPYKIEISKYQLKVFAMLFSPFEDVLMIDSDNLAVEQPEHLLSSEPFTSMGFVSWPDYWANTASPKYYTISSQPPPPVSTRASSESGQLLLSKSKHASTLLLSLYYNIYGPSHYYPLLSQGAVGQGDKETYLAAATAMNTTFWSVQSNIEELGHFKADGGYKGCGAVQHNPSDDYALHTQQEKGGEQPLSEGGKEARRSFIHAQTYKMDAARLPDYYREEVNTRMWGPVEGMMQRFGVDVEKQLWAETLYTACELKESFSAWENRTNVCEKLGEIYKGLFDEAPS